MTILTPSTSEEGSHIFRFVGPCLQICNVNMLCDPVKGTQSRKMKFCKRNVERERGQNDQNCVSVKNC